MRLQPIRRRNTAPSEMPARSSQVFSQRTVSRARYALLPSPAWSVVEGRIRTLPVPSGRMEKSSRFNATSSERPSLDAVAGETHHPADGVAKPCELLQLALRHLGSEGGCAGILSIRWDNGVAGEAKIAELRLVSQGGPRCPVRQLKENAVRQVLASESLVVGPWRRAVLVRVGARRGVGAEVERGVDGRKDCHAARSSADWKRQRIVC